MALDDTPFNFLTAQEQIALVRAVEWARDWNTWVAVVEEVRKDKAVKSSKRAVEIARGRLEP